MKNLFSALICASALVFTSMTTFAQGNIVEVASGSKDHTTLVTAVKAADLVATLTGAGPFTVFAPTNDAFAMLPAGTLETLLKPESKATLKNILLYHVVKGNLMAKDVLAAIEKGKGTANLKTVGGGMLHATLKGNTVVLEDEKGALVKVATTDLKASNGVIHVVSGVLMPK